MRRGRPKRAPAKPGAAAKKPEKRREHTVDKHCRGCMHFTHWMKIEKPVPPKEEKP